MKIVVSSEGRNLSIRITDGTLIIGRSSSCNVTLQDPILSRQHCALTRDVDRVICTDLGSSNGTFLDGESIQSADLKHGSIIEIGETAILFINSESKPLQDSGSSYRNSERVQDLKAHHRDNDSVPDTFEEELVKLAAIAPEVVVDTLADHVLHERESILVKTDVDHRQLLARSLDRVISDGVIEQNQSRSDLKKAIVKIIREERP